MMAWRVAKSLLALKKQVDAGAPNRAKGADGSIGDAAHASRSSDHNPWVRDGGMGVVTAIDITHDPRRGVDTHKMAEQLRRSKDRRIKYVISNGRIFSSERAWAWREYNGSNPHAHHVHVSVMSSKALYDDVKPWSYGQLVPKPSAPVAAKKPTLKKGSTGSDVGYLQTMLGMKPTKTFDAETLTQVLEFQKLSGLVVDGIVGPLTWDALMKGKSK